MHQRAANVGVTTMSGKPCKHFVATFKKGYNNISLTLFIFVQSMCKLWKSIFHDKTKDFGDEWSIRCETQLPNPEEWNEPLVEFLKITFKCKVKKFLRIETFTFKDKI